MENLRWSSLLSESAKARTRELMERVERERAAGKTIYPPKGSEFRALRLTPPDKVKVVIVGQDPYHEPGQANGLAFSVAPGIPCPPSLINIFKELRDDIGIPIPSGGDLVPWAEQGVLLLNTVLTVERGIANSHKGWGWQELTGEIFRVCTQLPQPVAFLLWGRQAIAFVEGVKEENCKGKLFLRSSHPSPLGATKSGRGMPAFFGSKPFSKANEWLREAGSEEVKWGAIKK